jgi:hypothetical protein
MKVFKRDGTTQAPVQAGSLTLGGATIGSYALATIGSVGIAGAASGNATGTLQVLGGLSNSTFLSITANSTTDTATIRQTATGGTLALGGNNTTQLTLTTNSAVFGSSVVVQAPTITAGAATALTLQSANVTAATIDTSQRFLVGTTASLISSSEKFAVNGKSTLSYASASTASLSIQNTDATVSTVQPYIYFYDGGGNRGGIGVQSDTSNLHMFGQAGLVFYTGAANFTNARLTISSSGAATFSGTVKTLVTTVGSLPSAATSGAGARAFVTDATNTVIVGLGLTVVGGGANKVPVYSDGTNWIIG